MKRSLQIYLDHGEAYGNLGDEAMLVSAVERLSEYMGKCKFIVPSQNGKPLPSLNGDIQLVEPPRWIFRLTGRIFRIIFRLIRCLPYISRFVPSERRRFDALVWKNADRALSIVLPLLVFLPNRVSKAINVLKTCDIFYGVGAASLNDFNLRDIAYRTWLYRTVRPWVKVSVASSQGLGPVNNSWARGKLKEAFGNLDFLSFRDCSSSISLVEELQPQNVKYSIVGDEAFSLSIADEARITELLEEAGLQKGASFIAFHFRTTDYTQDTTFLIPELGALLDDLCRIVPHFLVFFPMSYHIHSTYDIQCGGEVKRVMSQSDRLLLAPLCKDVRVVKGAIGKAVYSLGLGYHLHVFAVSQDKPAIILYTGDYYRYKSEGLIGFYGDPCKAINLQNASIEEILKAIRYLENNYDEAVKGMARVNMRMRKINDWHLRELKSRMESKTG